MKKFLYLILILSILTSFGSVFAQDDFGEAPDIDVQTPVDVAKQYVANKYGVDANDLTTGDVLIGRGAGHVEVLHGYNTETVYLLREGFSNNWKVDRSESNWH